MKPTTQVDPHECTRQRLYEAQCLKCQDNVHSVQQEFDKAILTLSAGLMGISLAFIKDIVPLELAIDLPLLYASWVFGVGAIIVTLASFWTSKNAFNAQLAVLYEEHMSPGKTLGPTRAALFTRWLTCLEAACFLVSILLTVGFAVGNIQGVAQRRGGPPAAQTRPRMLKSRVNPTDSQIPKTDPSGENVK